MADLLACHNGRHLSPERRAELEATAAALCRRGKGITACDESVGTLGGRFEKVGVENTVENRRMYRQMLFETPGTVAFLSGAILDPETIYQKSSASGKTFPEVLTGLGIVPGVKPHLKAYALPGQDGSTIMQGLDSLAVRCKEYYQAGCRFAKWRSPITIDLATGQPSVLVIEANMRDLARYALICQDEGLVPIVEPDVVLKGDYDLAAAVAINVKVQSALYKAMLDHGVFMEGATLKPNMINPGKSCATAYTRDELAVANLQVLRRCFPTAMKGLNYLSGGQPFADAAARLDAINKAKGPADPWNLSFSWSTALQNPLLDLCKGHGTLRLEEMAQLYVEELSIAAKASVGEHDAAPGVGDHRPPAAPVADAPDRYDSPKRGAQGGKA